MPLIERQKDNCGFCKHRTKDGIYMSCHLKGTKLPKNNRKCARYERAKVEIEKINLWNLTDILNQSYICLLEYCPDCEGEKWTTCTTCGSTGTVLSRSGRHLAAFLNIYTNKDYSNDHCAPRPLDFKF